MSINNPIVLLTFTFRHEVELAQTQLEAGGIECIVTVDDCGGIDPTINPAEAARLIVDAKDARRAGRVVAG